MAEKADQFVKKYHIAIVVSAKDRVEERKARIASEWVKD